MNIAQRHRHLTDRVHAGTVGGMTSASDTIDGSGTSDAWIKVLSPENALRRDLDAIGEEDEVRLMKHFHTRSNSINEYDGTGKLLCDMREVAAAMDATSFQNDDMITTTAFSSFSRLMDSCTRVTKDSRKASAVYAIVRNHDPYWQQIRPLTHSAFAATLDGNLADVYIKSFADSFVDTSWDSIVTVMDIVHATFPYANLGSSETVRSVSVLHSEFGDSAKEQIVHLIKQKFSFDFIAHTLRNGIDIDIIRSLTEGD